MWRDFVRIPTLLSGRHVPITFATDSESKTPLEIAKSKNDNSAYKGAHEIVGTYKHR